MNLRGEVAIAGLGVAESGSARKTNLRLLLEAAVGAAQDAGLPVHDIDSIITGEQGAFSSRVHVELAEALGIPCTTLSANFPAGGGSTLATSLAAARWAIVAGVARHVLVISASTRHNPHWTREPLPITEQRGDRYYGTTLAGYAAILAQRYLHDRGAGPELLAEVAVASRRNAGRNPDAAHRDVLTVADVLASPLVASPLRELDCADPDDAGIAFVLTSAERARDLARPVVSVAGFGHATGPYSIPRRARGRQLARTPWQRAGRNAFDEAGIAVGDLAFAQVHDAYTVHPLLQIEQLGLAPDEEAPAFFAADSGRLPINTDGGGLSHSRGPTDYGQLAEAVRQLRGDAGERQIRDARVGLFSTASAHLSTVGVGLLTRV
jgi:acetyl-CoA acetyltransferase